MKSNDDSVRETNDDATLSKLSLVDVGYITDPFVKLFVQEGSYKRRSPLINRGYFARVHAIQKLIRDFITVFSASVSKKLQIVSFGAGFDTTYFRLKNALVNNSPDNIIPAADCDLTYYELDFREVVKRKSALIFKHPQLADLISKENLFVDDNNTTTTNKSNNNETTTKTGEIYSKDYNLLVADLRDLDGIKKKLTQQNPLLPKFDTSVPTLFLSECVLIYLPESCSNEIIRWAATEFTTSMFVVYEQILPNDSFGKMMVKNLEQRGCPLLSIHKYPTLQSQKKRFSELGYARVAAYDMNEVYNKRIDQAERRRIERLEMLDEYEEWFLIQAHYFLLVAVNVNHNNNNNNSDSYTTARATTDSSNSSVLNDWLQAWGL